MSDELRIGQIIRIKEIPGTKLASNRRPFWATLESMPRNYSDAYAMFGARTMEPWAKTFTTGPVTSVWIYRRNFDVRPDHKIPKEVWAWVAMRALLGEDA